MVFRSPRRVRPVSRAVSEGCDANQLATMGPTRRHFREGLMILHKFVLTLPAHENAYHFAVMPGSAGIQNTVPRERIGGTA